MDQSQLKALAGIAAALSLSACCCICQGGCYQSKPVQSGVRTIVTVVPATADGHIGAVVINPGPKQIILNTTYGSVRVDEDRDPVTFTSSAAAVDTVFAQTRRAQPEAPISYTAFFILGTDDLNPESLDVLNQVLAESRRRASSEITVIGHTDRVGTDEANDALSQQRAERIREQLIRLGVREDIIFATGRGEREPVTDTEDGAQAPRNRRVEISVR